MQADQRRDAVGALTVTRVVVLTLVLVCTGVLCAFGVFDYRLERGTRIAALRAEMQGTVAELATSLALPLWNFETEQVQKIVESTMQDDDVHAVVVKGADGVSIVYAGGRDQQGRVVPVRGTIDGRGLLSGEAPIAMHGNTVGAVQVFVSPRAMEASLRNFLWVSVAAMVTVDLILVLIPFYLIRKTVIRPLKAIEGYALAVSGGDAHDPHIPEAGFFGELETLRRSIVQMTRSLAQARDDLVHRLEERVAERTAELHQAQSELLATARHAGMAEIATNVLHNVGNVLNSVNISAGLIAGTVRSSRLSGLPRAVALLKAHEGDLGAFFTDDEKGRLLPEYLEKLAQALEGERQGVLAELAQLTKSVDHIKDIVATQQSYARAGSVVETVRVADLVEDALGMNEAQLRRHQVSVLRDYAVLPAVPLDKPRMLLILVNLISNAASALSALPEGEARLTLRVELAAQRVLRVVVADNGAGIAEENLARIFGHGFTTRKDGHGFGLHSSALAAREMGGTLRGESEGEGRGATFILELPVLAGG